MRVNVPHFQRVLLAKGWTRDELLDIWINPQGDWFHMYPDGVLGRLNPRPLVEHDPVPQQRASINKSC